MLISQRMLIKNRARPGGVQEENIFSAFMLRSEGTHRMLISPRMLNRIQPRRAPNARNLQRTIKKCEYLIAKNGVDTEENTQIFGYS